MSPDQDFKNQIVDYPLASIRFYAGEYGDVADDARITPIRQEQLKERLGDRFRELDVPLIVESPGHGRAAIVFDFEEQTDPEKFRIRSLARYVLDLSELCQTDRIVPVVIFLRKGEASKELHLGVEGFTCLDFRYLSCWLNRLEAEQFFESDNIVARMNLPTMSYAPERKVEVYEKAMEGLVKLEPDFEKRRKYADFIDNHSGLTPEERLQWLAKQARSETMSWFTEQEQKAEARGEAKGKAEGKAAGKAEALVTLVSQGVLSRDQALTALDSFFAEGAVPAEVAAEVRRALGALH